MVLQVGDRLRSRRDLTEPDAFIDEIRSFQGQAPDETTVIVMHNLSHQQVMPELTIPLKRDHVENWSIRQLEEWIWDQGYRFS